MAKNGPIGHGRIGEIRHRSQVFNPKTDLWVRRNTMTGKFMDDKISGGKFKDIRREK